MQKSIFLFLCCCLAQLVAAQTFTSVSGDNNLQYEVITDQERCVRLQGLAVGQTSGVGDLIIPENVEYNGTNYSVIMIDTYAFRYTTGFTGRLEIPNTVRAIGTYAFEEVSGFTGDLVIPNSVVTIGTNAFREAKAFTGDLVIPHSVTSFGTYAFRYCSGFVDLQINMKDIPESTWAGGGFLPDKFSGSLIFGDSVRTIGDRAFDRCDGFKGQLIIGKNVRSIGEKAFNGCFGFTGDLVIGDSVKTIGDYAFYGCEGFKGGLTVGDAVESIGFQAFRGCSGFTGDLVIGDKVEVIENDTFYGCSGFTGDLVIGDSVKSIGNYAFYGCEGFTGGLTIGDKVELIGDKAFSGCSGFIGDLVIGKSVIRIGKDAFAGCSFTNMTVNMKAIHQGMIPNGFTGSLTIGEQVDTIGERAFYDCKSFTGNLNLGSSVKYIGESAFYGCSGFTGDLVVGDKVEVIDSYAFYDCEGFKGSLTIGDAVESIGSNAFSGCDSICGLKVNMRKISKGLLPSTISGSLIIGESVDSIAEGAFYGFSKFTGSLSIPNSVEYVGPSAFYGCSGFTGELTLPSGLKEIYYSTFSGCSGLTGDLKLPESLTAIGNQAFYMCSGLIGDLLLPNLLTTIGSEAFYKCSGLKGELILGNSLESIYYNAFSYCEFSGLNVNIPVIRKGIIPRISGTLTLGESVDTIADGAFEDYDNFTGNLTIPNSVRYLGEKAFEDCSGFTGSLTIGSSIDSIRPRLFYGCSGFTGDLMIPNSVKSIGTGAFYKCEGFTGNLTLGDSLETIGASAFSGCSGFTGDLTLPNRLDSIGANAFSACSGMTGDLTIPNSLRAIETAYRSNLFEKCNFEDLYINMSDINTKFDNSFSGDIIFGDSVRTIGSSAFYGCSNLKGTIKWGESIEIIGASAFYGCSGITGDLNVPNSVDSIGTRAFRGCSGMTGDLRIPESVRVINEEAFDGCNFKDLHLNNREISREFENSFTGSLILGDSVRIIGTGAFIANTKFSGEIVWGSSVEAIEDKAFYGCSGFTGDLTIPNSVKTIGNEAFRNCSGFTGDLTIPNSVRWMSTRAFYGSTFKDLHINMDTITGFSYDYFTHFTGTLHLGDSVRVIGDRAFYGTGFSGVLKLSVNLKTIENYAFQGCDEITSVYLNASLDTLRRAFQGCNQLDTLIIPEAAKDLYIESDCFSSSKLSTVIYNAENIGSIGYIYEPWGGGTYISDVGFSDSLRHIIIGENVKHIPWTPFYYCDSVKEVGLPEGIESVHARAFSPHTIIKNITKMPFPKGMTATMGILPASSAHIYDFDKDGDMEIVDAEYQKIYFASSMGHQKSKIASGGNLISIDNVYRDEDAELIISTYDQEASKNVWQLYDTDGGLVRQDAMLAHAYEFEHMAFDANGDGRTDYLNVERTKTSDKAHIHHIAYQQADGSYVEREIEVITDSAEIGDLSLAQYSNNPVSPVVRSFNIWTGGTGIGYYVARPSSVDMISGPQRQIASEILRCGGPVAMDVNMDGLLDLVNLDGNNALLSLGNERYYYGTLNGTVSAKDLTGDGMLDYIVYNEDTKKVSLLIYEGEGQYLTKELFQNFSISGIHCYDFDKDKDVDILLTFDYSTEASGAFCVFFENVRNVFKKREEALAEMYFFAELKDYDNDGRYELLAYKLNNDSIFNRFEFKLIECKEDFTIEVDEQVYLKAYDYTATNQYQKCGLFSGDVNNDGLLETWILNLDSVRVKSDGKFYTDYFDAHGQLCSENKNTAPAQMAAPRVLNDRENELVRIEWELGSDAEQSPLDLTYALRIGTSPGKGDVVYAHADENGRRLRLGEGNAGYSLYKYFMTESWSIGTYYVSVQAVDGNDMGGAWSEEVSFTVEQQNSVFDMPVEQITVNDTIMLQTKAVFNPEYDYRWDFGNDANVVQSGEGYWCVTYSTPGTKTITHQLRTSPSDSLAATHKETLYVSAMDYEATTDKIARQGVFADIDLDGELDLFGWYSNSGVQTCGIHESKGEGTFQKVLKTFNTDINMNYYPLVCDVNQDGVLDFLVASGKANGSNTFINEGRFSFTDEKRTYNFIDRDGVSIMKQPNFDSFNWVDINNDGYLDYFENPNNNIGTPFVMYINQGDNFTFNEIPEGIFVSSDPYILEKIDINSDGYVDLITQELYNSYNSKIYLRINEGNMNFSEAKEGFSIDPRSGYFSDINNDGRFDFVANTRRSTIMVLLGDDSFAYNEYVELDIEGESVMCRGEFEDYDNNGFVDMMVYVDDVEGICYMYEGFKTKFVPLEEISDLEEIFPSSPYMDLNEDGAPDFRQGNMKTKVSNEAPAAPRNVRATQTVQGITLAWDAAVDKETAKAQMRYNISLKKKDAEGEGAYILSPLNEGLDDIPIVSTHAYQHATEFTVPYERLNLGEDYELKVQAIDSWNEASVFSETYEFTMSEELFAVTERTELCELQEVVITATGSVAQEGTPAWTVDGGTIVSTDGNAITVMWEEEGMKQVNVMMNEKTAKTSILVKPTMDLTFTLPTTVLSGGYVYFTLPEVFADMRNDIRVRTSFMSDRDFVMSPFEMEANESAIPSIEALNDTLIVERRGNTLDARMLTVAEDGTYWIELLADDKNCGVVSYRQSFNVIGKNVTPQIGIVGIDTATGKSKIQWEKPSDIDLKTGMYDKVVILKEMGATNNYEVLDEVDVNTTSYVDMTSDPFVRKGRYRIALRTSLLGMMSNPSKVHSNVHVMLNCGMVPNSVNIVWTSYEGAVIDQYTILRGTSPDNMQVLTTASGYESSYTDFGVPEGDIYYALEYTNTYDNSWNSIPALHTTQQCTGVAYASKTGRSSALNANSAVHIRMAESLNVYCLQDEIVLTPTQEHLYLYAEVLPSMASYRTVSWRIVSGEHLATIDQSGVIRYCGAGENGVIEVEATTIDGSDLSHRITVSVNGFDGSDLPPVTNDQAISVQIRQKELRISGAEGEDVVIYSISGVLVKYIKAASTNEIVELHQSGVYVVCSKLKTFKCIVP